ncbi:GspH/FimT family protein [Methylophaga sp. OBS3]|uniref:GspH/FimT family pseudopilin n=1 Tax=Methylophaga sp. OBS3 TaxID=2991934 RepID=UPI002B1CC22C|nr:GspH/FimT family protein [Methylophaga sp. OBS3]
MKGFKSSTIILSEAKEGIDMPLKNRLGFTLIELMIVIAVLAVLAAIALPSFQTTLEKRRVTGAADNLFAALHFARSEAIKQNNQVQFQFDANTWCYGIDDAGSDCDCSAEPANCTISGQQKIGLGNDYRDVVLTVQNFNGNDIVFSPRQGMPLDPNDSGVFTLSINNFSKMVSINAVGRITMD